MAAAVLRPVDRLLVPGDWRGFRHAEFPDASWTIERDVLHAVAGAEAVSLVTRAFFGDFDLSFAWRVAVGGNTGLLYCVSEDTEEPWQSGPEMQLIDNGNHPDGRVPETSCGALYGLVAPERVPQCPPGLFNFARVKLRGSRVEHWLNGVRVLDCDLDSEDVRRRIASSKFRDLPAFAAKREGHIVLQHHGTEAWFYNLRIEY